jgi:hypothetical protein
MKYIYSIIITTLLLSSCKDTQENFDQLGKTISPLNGEEIKSNFDNLIEDVKIIPLELKGEESYIISIGKVLRTNSSEFIILNNVNILKFGSKGDFIHQIGSSGTGPGEYVKIMDICLSLNGENLLVLDSYNNVLIYDTETGIFKEKVKSQWPSKDTSFDAIAPSRNGGFYLYASNPGARNATDLEDSFMCLGEFDSKGILVEENFGRKDFNFTNSRFSQSYKNEYIMRPIEGYSNITAFKIGESIEPFVSLDFDGKFIPDRFIYKDSENPWSNIPNFVRSGYYKLPMEFRETKNHIYFWCGGPEANMYEFIVEKETGKSFYWIDKGDKMPFSFKSSDETGFYTYYNELSDDQNSLKGPLKKFIEKNYGLSKNDIEANPLIVKITFAKDFSND